MASAPAIPAYNKTVNPSFESNVSSWSGWEATIARQADEAAPDGAYAAKVTASGTPSDYSIGDSPHSIPSSVAGHTYTARAYVKASAANNGKTVWLTVREWNSEGEVVDSHSKQSTISSSGYIKLEVTYAALENGDEIDVHAWRGSEITSNESLYIDAITLASDVIPTNNKIVNPSFEESTTTWEGWEANISRKADSSAPDGSQTLQVTAKGTPSDYSFFNVGKTISSSLAGHVYTGHAFVRATAANNEKTARITIREWHENEVVGSESTSFTIYANRYIEAAVDYEAISSGDQIDFYVWRGSEITAGESFYADALSLAADLIPLNNQTANPSFEESTSTWAGWQSTIARTPDSLAPDGSYSLKVTAEGKPSDYSFFNEGKTVRSSAAGQVYTGKAFVKGTGSTNGKNAYLTVREWNENEVVGSNSSTISLTSSGYVEAEVDYTAVGSGDQIDVFVWRGSEITSEESMYVDAISLSPARILMSDVAGENDPLPSWGSIDCQEESRYERLPTEGDPSEDANGEAQGNISSRRLTVYDGDDFYGERCELGYNNHFEGPTALYREGRHLLTFISVRLPENFNTSGGTWQTVFQIKQSQPSDGGGLSSPVLTMHVYNGEWKLDQVQEGVIWSAPAKHSQWTRFVLDGLFSQDSERGWIHLYADLNGDGDFLDANEQAEKAGIFTLATEVEGPLGTSDGLDVGDPIPGHLRTGIYHCSMPPVESNPCVPAEGPDPWPCPPPPFGTGCSIDIDNVQIALAED